MNTISKISAVAVLAVTLWSCGPSRVTVSAQPEAPYYVRPVAPHPGWIWVGDDYYWRGGRYEYRHGYWAAPRPNHVYVQGRWEHRGNGYYWHRGGWR